MQTESSQDEQISQVRQALTKKILTHADEIIDAAIDEAKNGHYSITRLLFGIAGLYPAPRGASDASDHSLADLLCKELGLPEPDNTPSPPTSPPDPAHSLK